MRHFMTRSLAITSLALAFSSSLVDAQTTWTSVGPFVIKELKSDFSPSEGMVIVPPSGTVIPNPAGCPAGSEAGLIGTNPSYKTLSAMVMAATMSGKPVRLWFANPSSCAVGRPAFVGIDIIN